MNEQAPSKDKLANELYGAIKYTPGKIISIHRELANRILTALRATHEPSADVAALEHDLDKALANHSADLSAAYEPPAVMPETTGVGDYCSVGPADEQHQRFLLLFEDRSRGMCMYSHEDEARRVFAVAETHGWNCHLFGLMRRAVQPPASEPAAGCAQCSNVAPIANVIVSNGEFAGITMYAPGLPDGDHDVYPAASTPPPATEPSLTYRDLMKQTERDGVPVEQMIKGLMDKVEAQRRELARMNKERAAQPPVPEPHVIKQIEHALQDNPAGISREMADYIRGCISDYRHALTKAGEQS